MKPPFYLLLAVTLLSSQTVLANNSEIATADDESLLKVCRGDEITVNLASKTSSRPLIYTLDPTYDALPQTLSLNRRTGVISGIVRDSGFRNVYNIGIIGTDPTNQDSVYAQTKIQVDWCQGARVSRFWLVNTDTNTVVRVLNDGDTVSLGCLDGGFSIEVETMAEIATEAQSEGDLTDSIKFRLDGRLVRTEDYWPYALGGDNQGDYHEFPISLGEHRLEAIPYNASREKGLAMEIVFNIVP